MKKIISIVIVLISIVQGMQGQEKKASMAENATVVSLVQTPGTFTETSLRLEEGTYVFEIKNEDAGTDVGFVLIKQGEDPSNPENHITSAYVTQVVKEGTMETSNPTYLEKGTYTYFCPLNKTEMNTLVVE